MFNDGDGSKIVLTGEYFDRAGSENVYQPYENNTAGRAFAGAILPTKPWQLSTDLRPKVQDPAVQCRASDALRSWGREPGNDGRLCA